MPLSCSYDANSLPNLDLYCYEVISWDEDEIADTTAPMPTPTPTSKRKKCEIHEKPKKQNKIDKILKIIIY